MGRLLALHAQEAGGGPQTLTMAQVGGNKPRMMMRSYLVLAGTAIFICRYPWAFSPAPLGNPVRLRYPLCSRCPL